MTIMSYVMLSLYRIQESHSNLALFITFSTINSVYTCEFFSTVLSFKTCSVC